MALGRRGFRRETPAPGDARRDQEGQGFVQHARRGAWPEAIGHAGGGGAF